MSGRPFTKKEWTEFVRSHSQPNREDTLLKLLPAKLSLMSGLREVEISLLNFETVLRKDGQLRMVFNLPAKLSYNQKTRPVILNTELRRDLLDYLELLREKKVNRSGKPHYLGFKARSQLVVSPNFEPFQTQRRGHFPDSRPRIVPFELNRHLEQLIEDSNLSDKEITRKSFIRSFVIQAFHLNWNLTDIARVAGMTEQNVSKILVLALSQEPIIGGSCNEDLDIENEALLQRITQERDWCFSK